MEINEPLPEDAFTAQSSVAHLAMQIALRDGSKDNIITGSSCISLVLPVTVIVNGQEITVATEQDYAKVERLLDSYEDNSIEVVFPVTIILPDYTEIQITSEDELEDFIEDCIEEGEDDDIECVDFKYPLTFSLYDAKNQVTEAIVINNDKELLIFLDNLEDNVYVSIDFPVTLVLYDGSELLAYNNDELEDIIGDSRDECDEDDDNDFDDDDVDDTELRSFLTTGKWQITSYLEGDKKLDAFEGIEFSFYESGYVLTSDGTETFEGEWESYGDSGVLEIEFDFDSIDPVKELNEEWEVIQYTEVRIELEDSSGEEDVTIVFEKI